MDLDRCPKCGNAWQGGDKCRSCGFVPIGAGLDKLPKKKKKKAKKYVEPGSSRGFLSTVLLGACCYAAYIFQPWKDDWEMVRSWMGQGRHHSIVGEWEIKKNIVIVADKAPILADKGSCQFTDKGIVQIDLKNGEGQTVAKGKYEAVGPAILLSGMTASSSTAGVIPTNMKIVLVWKGADSVVAMINSAQALTLARHSKGSPLASMFQMGLKPEKAQAPGQMRGVIDTMKDNMKANESDN